MGTGFTRCFVLSNLPSLSPHCRSGLHRPDSIHRGCSNKVTAGRATLHLCQKYCCCCCNASKGMLLQQSMLNGRHCSVRHSCRVDDAGGGDSSWLVKMAGAQQGLRQDGRPGPTAASPHANAGHANNSGVAANPISIVYNK